MNGYKMANVQIDSRVIERIAEISLEVRSVHDRGELALTNLVSLLIDHWRSSPPRREWLKNQANLYPTRGRGPARG